MGDVAVAVNAALGADGSVDAGQLGGGDVGHRCGRRDGRRDAGLLSGAGRSGDRGACRSS